MRKTLLSALTNWRVLLVASFLLFAAITFGVPRLTEESGYYFVDSKQVTTKEGERQYFIYTTTETFRISPTYAYWDFKHANRYSAVEEKQCYKIDHIWWRGTLDWTLFWRYSWFENPVRFTKVGAELCR